MYNRVKSVAVGNGNPAGQKMRNLSFMSRRPGRPCDGEGQTGLGPGLGKTRSCYGTAWSMLNPHVWSDGTEDSDGQMAERHSKAWCASSRSRRNQPGEIWPVDSDRSASGVRAELDIDVDGCMAGRQGRARFHLGYRRTSFTCARRCGVNPRDRPVLIIVPLFCRRPPTRDTFFSS